MNNNLINQILTYLDQHKDKIATVLIIFGLSFLLMLILKKILSLVFGRIASFTKTNIENIIIDQINQISTWMILFTAIYISLIFISYDKSNPTFMRVLSIIFYLSWTIQVVTVINKIILEIHGKMISRVVDKSVVSAYSFISIILRSLTWVIGFLFVLSNLGFDVNTFIAGLGIGGLAIALALQNVLRDLFSSLLIITDKPIRINDYVNIGDFSGVVTEIGIRSTRLITDDGSEVIIPNGDLINRTIKNYKSRKTQKVSLSLSIKLDKTNANIIVNDLESIFNNNEEIQDDSLNIFLTERNLSDLKFKISFNLVKTQPNDLPLKLEKLINDIYDVIVKKGYNLEVITLDNPKI